MINYDKDEIKEQLTIEQHFELLTEWGGNPEYTNFGIISETICHNEPGIGSRKLYLYSNSGLYVCYTGCDEGRFDIFELCRKVADIQWNEEYDLNDAVRWIARRFGISGKLEDGNESEKIEDWKLLAAYDRIKDIELKTSDVELKEYNKDILERLNYNIKITPWINEGISEDALAQAKIGYYPGGDQITIPHFDKEGRFVGLRGRTVVKEEAELYGKYRPIKICGQLYNHPLGMNLYNFNNVKDNISRIQKAIVFEGEKSTLLYKSYFGLENDISVACCGSSISAYQIQLLREAGAKEIIIAFDRQFNELGDSEFKHLTKNLTKINDKYKNFVNISFIFDKKMLTGYKDSPIDCGPEIFMQLFKERIVL